MAKKFKIGILYQYFGEWTGGNYYLNNLILALQKVIDPKTTRIIVLTQKKKQVKKDFPSLNVKNPYNVKRTFFEAFINKIFFLLFKKDIIDKFIRNNEIDILYPATDEPAFKNIKNKVYWFADFQHKIYPDFFSSQELDRRENILKEIGLHSKVLILSSKNALETYKQFYPENKNKTFVIPFAVTLPDYHCLDEFVVLKKYNIGMPYFIVSNQFWKHKNHLVVIKAASLLKKKIADFRIYFTGQENGSSSGEYVEYVKSSIKEFDVETNISFLGFVERKEQLVLMKHAEAIIQPSLFEGWSTVVEDAKALNAYILLSDIEVHKEQIKENCAFFDPDNEVQLAQQMYKVLQEKPSILPYNYETDILNFGKTFMQTAKELFK